MTRSAALTLAALVASSAGCASMQAARVREKTLRAQLDALVYAKPLDEVWQEVRRLLNDRRYGLTGKDAAAIGLEVPSGLLTYLTPAKETQPDDSGGRFLETGWGPGLVRRRYHVDGFPAGGGGCRIVFTAIPEDTTERGHDGRDRFRDLELELDLARRVDPASAERVEAAVAAGGGGAGR